MAVFLASVASETVVILTVTSASVVFVASIETELELDGSTFFDCCNMPKIFSSKRLFPRRISTTSL